MQVWQRSNLTVGELITIPSELFIEPSKAEKRLLSATYIGETDAGLMVECSFIPGVRTSDTSKWHYKLFINWPSIWCGHVKVMRVNGEMVRARRMPGLPLALGQGVEEND